MIQDLDKGDNSGIWKEKRRQNIIKEKQIRFSRKKDGDELKIIL